MGSRAAIQTSHCAAVEPLTLKIRVRFVWVTSFEQLSGQLPGMAAAHAAGQGGSGGSISLGAGLLKARRLGFADCSTNSNTSTTTRTDRKGFQKENCQIY